MTIFFSPNTIAVSQNAGPRGICFLIEVERVSDSVRNYKVLAVSGANNYSYRLVGKIYYGDNDFETRFMRGGIDHITGALVQFVLKETTAVV